MVGSKMVDHGREEHLQNAKIPKINMTKWHPPLTKDRRLWTLTTILGFNPCEPNTIFPNSAQIHAPKARGLLEGFWTTQCFVGEGKSFKATKKLHRCPQVYITKNCNWTFWLNFLWFWWSFDSDLLSYFIHKKPHFEQEHHLPKFL